MGIWRSRWYSEPGRCLSDCISMVSSIFHWNLPSIEQFHSSKPLTPYTLAPSPAPCLDCELALLFPFHSLRRVATKIIYAVGKLSQVASHVVESVPVFLPSGGLNFYPGVGGHFPPLQRSIYQGRGNKHFNGQPNSSLYWFYHSQVRDFFFFFGLNIASRIHSCRDCAK